MYSNEVKKTIVQCDFDGTITEKDVSFLLLDAFADGNWRQLLEDYRGGKITVGAFNRGAFAMVKADKQTLRDFIFAKKEVEIRTGFNELLSYCSKKSFKFVIVSNGLDFYIEAVLKDVSIDNIEIYAAQTQFTSDGLKVKYTGPDGRQLKDNFKDAYTELFLGRGYRVVYIGNGISDFSPAKQAHHIFATSDLLTYCKEKNLSCTPFADLNDVVRGLELLPQG
ncbi:MAG: MtnX-like HAD-IB family phosphatase [Dehalococcoidales bacterium]